MRDAYFKHPDCHRRGSGKDSGAEGRVARRLPDPRDRCERAHLQVDSAGGAVARRGAAGVGPAQDGFAAELFEPRPELGRALLSVGTSDLLPQWRLMVGMVLHYEDDPVTLVDPDDRSRLLERLVDHRLTGEVMAAIGLTEWLTLGLAMPLVLAQSGTDLAPLGLDGAAVGGFALGDLRLVATFRLLGGGDGLGLTVGAVVSLPTGDDARLAGDGGVRLRPQLGIDDRTARCNRKKARIIKRILDTPTTLSINFLPAYENNYSDLSFLHLSLR
jgi:hypothetical protein